MKEIRLRAWHIEQRQMYPIVGWKKLEWFGTQGFGAPWLLASETFNLLIDPTENTLEWVIPTEIEVMQSTGLRDRNGKEIYEGDIVRSDFSHASGNVHQVVEAHSGFGLKLGSGTVQYFDPRETLEVIGNIYKNPQLLS